MQSRALHNSTQKTRTVHRPCKNRAAVLQENKKAMKSFDFTAFFGAMEGTRTPGLLIRSQSLYPAELPTHMFHPEQELFYHSPDNLSSVSRKYF